MNLRRHRGRTRERGRSAVPPADVHSRGTLSLGTLLGEYLLVRRGATDGDASARAARDVAFVPALYRTLHALLCLSPDYLQLGATELLADLT